MSIVVITIGLVAYFFIEIILTPLLSLLQP